MCGISQAVLLLLYPIAFSLTIGHAFQMAYINSFFAVERGANQLRQLIDTANAPIFGVNSGGRVTEWNRKAASLTGFAKEEAIGKDLVSRFIHAAKRTASDAPSLHAHDPTLPPPLAG